MSDCAPSFLSIHPSAISTDTRNQPYFYWTASRRAGDWPNVPIYEKAWIFFSIFIVTPWCFGFGLYAAFDIVVQDYQSGNITPFSCSGDSV